MAKKYYAVKKGKVCGIYLTWEDCKKMVDGYPGPVYKSFPTLEEAGIFLEGTGSEAPLSISNISSPVFDESDFGVFASSPISERSVPVAYAFVDGSFNTVSAVYGYGGFLFADGQKIVLQGNGSDPEMASMRNVAGEILGSQAAIQKAIEIGLPELTIYYDYEGIEQWATGAWKRNKTGTIAYHAYVQSIQNKIKLKFVKVKGHSGVEGNEEADRLAKEAVGLS